MTELYRVFVRADESGRIMEINSDAFLADPAGWVQIDEGTGDRYHHAQNNYLSGPLYDDRGIQRYKLVDGAVVERTPEEIEVDYVPPKPTKSVAELEEEISLLNIKLAAYEQAYAEGVQSI